METQLLWSPDVLAKMYNITMNFNVNYAKCLVSLSQAALNAGLLPLQIPPTGVFNQLPYPNSISQMAPLVGHNTTNSANGNEETRNSINETIEQPADEAQTTKTADGFSCNQCGKMFTYEYYRDKHLKYTRCVDNGKRKYPCAICDRSFEKRDRLRIHILHVHENHRPHVCTICSKSFSQSSSLNKHMRVHSGERPYKCDCCPKAFTASSILRTHKRQHSGEKPFMCSHCGKAFASHAAHDSHVRRSHLAKP
ncbi:unnamed protein product [Caenorhabditis bovis]|uniref:C2H2-type domain-containing protein n=1 Tax=Caenorhabditis bovis TaxID=2654633 RepID=A0A8S1ECM5_9PELO|nr:unnamed protein product [Caenorhabditis bovis]